MVYDQKDYFFSFRDPSGRLLKYQNKIFRVLNKRGKRDLNDYLSSKIISEMIKNKLLISYKIVPKSIYYEISKISTENIEQILEHPKISFPSYPYEWPSEMLYEAAKLTLSLSLSLLKENFSLKDASPYNILYNYHKPIFIDLLSIEKRKKNDPIWIPYYQFIRMFLLPLYLNKYYHMNLSQIFITQKEGLEIENCLKYVKYFHLLSYKLILIPYFLNKICKKNYSKLYKNVMVKNSALSEFILKSLFKSLIKKLKKLKPKNVPSFWLNYMEDKVHYSNKSFEQKEKIIKEILKNYSNKKLLDIGANTGHFSILAAKLGMKVIALDKESKVCGKLWHIAKENNLNIQPLVIDLSRPTPNIGWLNKEYLSFLKRCDDFSFDIIMMLALIHHLLIADRIPLEEIAKLATRLTNKGLIIEFISPEDSMFKKILKGREDLHKDYNIEIFKNIFTNYFKIISSHQLSIETRTIFYMEKIYVK